jgi:hypothetical protein
VREGPDPRVGKHASMISVCFARVIMRVLGAASRHLFFFITEITNRSVP